MRNEIYEQFVEKFKPKLTTDDCATPPLVYQAVLDWVCAEYKIDPEKVVRPFWPGQDYTKFNYAADNVVVDNPPFSILAEICKWYIEHGIKFFLFAPVLTIFSARSVCMKINHILCGIDVVYENGAKINTGFVSNLGDGETVAQTAPTLRAALAEAVRQTNRKEQKPKYEYPENILTSTMLEKMVQKGINFAVKRTECITIFRLDSQKQAKKTIYGGALLLSKRKAEQKRQALKAAEAAEAAEAEVTVWELSEREKALIKGLE